MDYTFLSSLMTVTMLFIFLAIGVWAYDGKRRAQFDEASRLPFEEDGPQEPGRS
jgi:cytochrome c oxidase cbb3-type subunit IV